MSLQENKIDEEKRHKDDSIESIDKQRDYCYMDDTGTLNIQSFGTNLQVSADFIIGKKREKKNMFVYGKRCWRCMY